MKTTLWEDKARGEQIDDLHSAYVIATGIRLRLNQASERMWYEAAKMGLHPSDISIVIADRKRRIKLQERNQACILMRNICGNEEAINDVLNEASVLKALQRKPTMDKGKAVVLKATGRDDEIKQGDAKPVGHYIEAMRRAVDDTRKAANDGDITARILMEDVDE